MNENTKFTLQVIDVIDNPDGSATINFDVSDEFIAWFKKDQGLKRWSQKRFQKWTVEAIENYISVMEDEEDKCFLSAEREFAALDDALETKDRVIHPGYVHACDVCGRVVDEYETVSCDNLAGVVMCAGKMKDSCKSPPYERGDET